jgi:hypothetical protein
MNIRPAIALVATVLLAGAPARGAVLDRHPEARSRALAWTEFDGSFLVDVTSRADMLDFYWTVLARSYPQAQWTGSTSPAVAGETAALWRAREYAQLNAYRALNYSRPMTEDPDRLPLVQEGALILALNPEKPVTHSIDARWIGYTAVRANALVNSLIGGANEYPLTGAADGFINDPGNENSALVGHRSVLLHDGNITGAVGAAFAAPINYHFSVWNSPLQFKAGPAGNFIAWPAPGWLPLALFRSTANPAKFRWSFVPATDDRDFDSLRNASVTARLNGAALPVRNLVRNFNPHPLTWEFEPGEFNVDTLTEDAAVEITVSNVVIAGSARSYRYTVQFFDETRIHPVTFNPRSALKNISTRGKIGSGEEVLIAGFVVGGPLPVRVAIRTQGPGLGRFGMTGTAGRIRLQLYDRGGNKLGENTAWKEHQDWRLLQSLGVSPGDDHEAGMVATLWPGSYTAVVSDDAGHAGIGLIEAFNIDNQTPSRLLNLSTRGLVGRDDEALIAGIIVHERPRVVLIRTQGPGLASLGVANAVSDPLLTVVDQSDGRIIAQNDDWRTDSRNTRLTTDLAGFAPSDNREAAILLLLPPGAYTALVTAKTNVGVGMVEVFDLDAP